jgi:hypothetical protein
MKLLIFYYINWRWCDAAFLALFVALAFRKQELQRSRNSIMDRVQTLDTYSCSHSLFPGRTEKTTKRSSHGLMVEHRTSWIWKRNATFVLLMMTIIQSYRYLQYKALYSGGIRHSLSYSLPCLVAVTFVVWNWLIVLPQTKRKIKADKIP